MYEAQLVKEMSEFPSIFPGELSTVYVIYLSPHTNNFTYRRLHANTGLYPLAKKYLFYNKTIARIIAKRVAQESVFDDLTVRIIRR